jgi:hypothetical protein
LSERTSRGGDPPEPFGTNLKGPTPFPTNGSGSVGTSPWTVGNSSGWEGRYSFPTNGSEIYPTNGSDQGEEERSFATNATDLGGMGGGKGGGGMGVRRGK